VYDPAENISLDLFSRNRRIAMDDEFISFLENEQEIDFRIN